MCGFFAFLHIIGFTFWLGSLFSVTLVLLTMKKYLDIVIVRKIIRKVIHTFNAIIYPASVVVLISGIYRVVQKDYSGTANSLWLNYMVVLGTVSVSLTIFLLAILGRRITILLPSYKTKTAILELRLSAYLSAVLLIMAGVLSVILLVSLRV